MSDKYDYLNKEQTRKFCDYQNGCSNHNLRLINKENKTILKRNNPFENKQVLTLRQDCYPLKSNIY